MASMTVRNLDDDVKARFVTRAKAAGQSAEGYLRMLIAREATGGDDTEVEAADDFADRILARAKELALTEEELAQMEAGRSTARADWTSDAE